MTSVPLQADGQRSGVPAAIRFPVPDPHFAYVRTRRRNSGLTSVRWQDDQTLYAADFSARQVYRVRPWSQRQIDAQISTLDGEGRPTETDLMDLRGDCMVLSNFYTGEVAVYSVGPAALEFDRIITVPSQHPRTRVRARTGRLRALLRLATRSTDQGRLSGRRAHGVVFIPRQPDLLWVSMCDAREKGVEIVALDGNPVRSIAMEEQAQDVAFIEADGVVYAIQAARTNHITVDAPNRHEMYATIYVYRLPADLRIDPPELLASARFPGHLDALKAYKGRVYAANQHDNCVDEFEYSPDDNEVRLLRRLQGFEMPHGLDIRHDGLMAVTNYEQNDLRFMQLD